MLLGQFLWELLNDRPEPQTTENIENDEFRFPNPVDRPITLSWSTRRDFGPLLNCSNGNTIQPASSTAQQNFSTSFSGVGFITGTLNGTQLDVCSGTNAPLQNVMAIRQLTAAGPGPVIATIGTGRVNVTTFTSRTLTDRIFNVAAVSDGVTITNNRTVQPTFAPGVKPEIDEQELEQSPSPPPQPLPAVAPIPILPPAAPNPSPVPPPAPAPGGLPSTAPAPVSRPATSTARPTTSQPVPAQPAPQQVPAVGPLPQLPPAVPQTAPGTTFLPGGRPLTPNGPPPTMEGMAGELGKLEQKLEILLNPDDTLSPLELLNKVIDQVENIEFLIERLFPPEPYRFDPGAYQLAPICDRDAEGVLVPPLEAPWAGGEGEFTELRQRIDALAQLIQHHKTLKQPTCGPRGSGPHSNVTVHFESD